MGKPATRRVDEAFNAGLHNVTTHSHTDHISIAAADPTAATTTNAVEAPIAASAGISDTGTTSREGASKPPLGDATGALNAARTPPGYNANLPPDIAALAKFNSSITKNNNAFRDHLSMMKAQLAQSRTRAKAMAAVVSGGSYNYTTLKDTRATLRQRRAAPLTMADARRIAERSLR